MHNVLNNKYQLNLFLQILYEKLDNVPTGINTAAATPSVTTKPLRQSYSSSADTSTTKQKGSNIIISITSRTNNSCNKNGKHVKPHLCKCAPGARTIVGCSHYAPNSNTTSSHNPVTSVASQKQQAIAAVILNNGQQRTIQVERQQHQQQQPHPQKQHKERIGDQQRRNIRKFMKGLLRQRLDSIAGKVLAVASAAVNSAASPVKKRRTAAANASATTTTTVAVDGEAAVADTTTTQSGEAQQRIANVADAEEERYVQVCISFI